MYLSLYIYIYIYFFFKFKLKISCLNSMSFLFVTFQIPSLFNLSQLDGPFGCVRSHLKVLKVTFTNNFKLYNTGVVCVNIYIYTHIYTHIYLQVYIQVSSVVACECVLYLTSYNRGIHICIYKVIYPVCTCLYLKSLHPEVTPDCANLQFGKFLLFFVLNDSHYY
jgi:hypothetical protein